jgi:hypothetical protein
MEHDQRNSGDEFGADNGNCDQISCAFTYPRQGDGGGSGEGGWLVCFHATLILIAAERAFILARYGPKPKNAAIVAIAFQGGNGPVVLLVASTGTNIFIGQQRAGNE